jgi:hypothetical protein
MRRIPTNAPVNSMSFHCLHFLKIKKNHNTENANNKCIIFHILYTGRH